LPQFLQLFFFRGHVVPLSPTILILHATNNIILQYLVTYRLPMRAVRSMSGQLHQACRSLELETM